MLTKWIYINEKGNKIRYVLGIEGDNPLVCMGINPSTAVPQDLDNTLKSVERLAFSNGFDSWIMLNVYPQRATDPNNMHQEIDPQIHGKNIENINKIFAKEPVIWAGWGTIIEKRPYLMDCLTDIYDVSKKYNCKWISLGKISKKGHPHHPLYLRKDEKIKDFDMDGYMEMLKTNIK